MNGLNLCLFLKLPAAETSAELEPSSSVVVEHNVEHVTKECTKCPSYKAQLANCSEEIKKKEADIERLKDEMNKLRSQLRTSKKVFEINKNFPCPISREKSQKQYLSRAIIFSWCDVCLSNWNPK